MYYNKFKEELERKMAERRRQKSSSWINLIIRILILVFVVIIIRYFSTMRVKRLEYLQRTQQNNSLQIEQNAQ
ncbi:MAG TPA: hypothetical protein PLD62_02240 [Candidatus Cloacimonadota bacterium]|nr:hypothetical protein [Candidatus Cloacimonadota bacterium]